MAFRMRKNGAESKTRSPGEFLLRCRRELVRHVRGALSGNDADAVHDMRVASRRLRAALAFLKKDLPTGRCRRATRRLQRFTRALGALRQFDVSAQLLDRIIAESAEARPAAEFARPFLAADRGRALTATRKALRRADLGRLDAQVKDLAQRLEDCDVKSLSRRAAKKATRRGRRLSRLWGSNGAGAGRSGDAADKERLHAIRISTKKLRYHLESGRRICGWKVAPALQAAREVQEALGELHDYEGLRHWCEARREEAAGPMGELIRHLRERESVTLTRVSRLRDATHEALAATVATA